MGAGVGGRWLALRMVILGKAFLSTSQVPMQQGVTPKDPEEAVMNFQSREFPETVTSEWRNCPKIIGVEDDGFLIQNLSFTNKIKGTH